MSFQTSLHATKSYRKQYALLRSTGVKVGGPDCPECMVPPTPSLRGGGWLCPRPPRLRRLCNPVGTAPRTLRAHELKFHIATKHDQPLLGFHASRALELLSVVEENIMRGPNGTC